MSTVDKQALKHLGDLSMEEPKQSTEDECFPSVEGVEDILGYKFNNKKLLEEAFIHSSYGPARDNDLSYERLEFLGDAVLHIAFVKELYLKYPNLKPGVLTNLLSANVETEKLARVAMTYGLHRYLRHKKHLLQERIQAFELVIKEYPLSSKGLEDAPKTLADLTEALIGAVYIDCNFNLDFVWQVFKSLLEPIITPEKLTRNHVTVLKEFCDQNKLKLEYVDKCNEISMQFDVYIDEQLMGTGTGTYGRKKDIAKNRATKNAFNNYNLLKFMDDTQKENELAEQK